MPNEKLTDEQKEEIVYEYLYGSTPTTAELAAKYGVSKSTISRVLSHSQTLHKLEQRAKISAQRALIRAQLNSDDIMRLTIEDAKKTREDRFGYLHQNARREVLDRAGIRAKDSEESTLTIRFADGAGFDMGETADVEIVESGNAEE